MHYEKNNSLKNMSTGFVFLDTSMPTGIPQVVDGTVTVMSKDVKMRMISSRIPSKSFSYP